jgi:hypothetical protein
MDPYLELRQRWPGVHHSLLVALSDALNERLPEDLYATLDLRVYVDVDAGGELVGLPDVTVTRVRESPAYPYQTYAGRAEAEPPAAAPEPGEIEVELPLPPLIRVPYLEVREVESSEVVASVDLLSPINKRQGDGRRQYEGKRLETLNSRASFVEIDLLRVGEPMPVWLQGRPVTREIPGHYRILVSRGHERPRARLYAFTVRDPIPVFRFPLRSKDAEPEIDLRPLLDGVYDRGRYQARVNYRLEADPPLDAADAAWAEEHLRAAGRR